jgi:multimeric flavodoxin WrbA
MMDAATPSVVAVVGSPRRRGNTSALVATVLEELEACGAACETIVLSGLSIAPCLAHDTCGDLAVCPHEDDAADVLDRVYAADCLILGTPVYYENVSAQMKAFIDRNVFRYSHDEFLRARVVGLVAVTAKTGLGEALDALRRYVALSSDGEIPVFACAGCADEAGAAAADQRLLAEARRLGADLAGALGLSRA